MKRINVCDLNVKEEITSVFLLKYVAYQESKDGKGYLNVVLADGTGDLEARVWTNAAEVIKNFTKGDFVQVKGKLNIYQGRRQFIIAEMSKMDAKEINQDDFMMKAATPSHEMFERLLTIVKKLDDIYIKELLLNILQDTEVSRRLKLWQAGKTIHHAYQSGLLEHILSCTELGVTLSKHYQVNHNYVVAGCILHDLCKIYELTNGVNVDYTEEGKLIGHLAKSLEIVDRYCYKIRNFPYETKMHLKHILLSHHGEYAYGSPKLPQSSEAYLVHLIDLMDSKMNALEMVKRTDMNTGHWSGFVKHLDRVVYKADLPFYDELIPERDQEQAPQPKRTEKFEAKTNLGKMLEGFKIEGE